MWIIGLFLISFFECADKRRGLTWWGQDQKYLKYFRDSKLSWYYNWAHQPSFCIPEIEYAYMLWNGAGADEIALIEKVGIFLGFNEPDYKDQANMSPEESARIYHQYITPLKKSGQIVRLGSPGITNNGWDWMDTFMSLCADCEIDFLAYHWVYIIYYL
jgi:hypothetical protein